MSTSSWKYEAREELCKRVSELAPPCLSDVVHIIYGHSEEIVSGDEFLVDFASLSGETCSKLQEYLDNNQEAEDDIAILLNDDSLVSPPPTKVNVDVVRDLRGSLESSRVVLAADRSSCSVLACRGQQHLLLRDDDLSLEWIKDAAQACAAVAEESSSSSSSSGAKNGQDDDNRATASDCYEVLRWLEHLDVVQPFLKPVDSLFAPLYDHVVDEPMDLGTISKKLCKGEYSSGSEFARDVRLVHRNAIAYCERGPSPDAAVYRAAQVLISAFERRWRLLSSSEKKKKKPKSFGKIAHRRQREENEEDEVKDVPKDRCVEIYSNNQWRRCTVGESRKRDRKHRIEYESSGKVAWVDLTKERYRPAEPPQKRQKKGEISVQKLGILVWAKSGEHPWWPAELCLPTTDRILESLPPPSKKQPQTCRKNFVYYFGETQYDILDVADVVLFDAKPKPTTKNKDLQKAYRDAVARRAELLDKDTK